MCDERKQRQIKLKENQPSFDSLFFHFCFSGEKYKIGEAVTKE